MLKNSFFLTLQVVWILVVAGCGSQPQLEVGYQPPIIPVRVSINTRGEVDLDLSGSYVTPIGTFDIGGSVTVASLRGEYESKVLIIRVDNEAVVYELEEGKEFKVTFNDSNTLYRKVALKHEANGDIILELESVQMPVDAQPPPSDSKSADSYWCDDLSGVKLDVGDGARITWPKVNLRSTPRVPEDFYENIVAELVDGTSVTIIGGPVCAHEGTWWEIRTASGQTGWVREYISDGYLMKPR